MASSMLSFSDGSGARAEDRKLSILSTLAPVECQPYSESHSHLSSWPLKHFYSAANKGPRAALRVAEKP